MLKNSFILLIAIVFSLSIKAQQNYELVWSDNFDYTGKPNPEKWDYDIGGDGWGNRELQNYTNNIENAFVKDGVLTIHAKKTDSTWTSARLVTRGKADWCYGKIEVSAKLAEGRGTWPAIWMLPTKSEYGTWPASGEIDIMEHVGYEMNVVHGTTHTEAYHHSIGTQKGESRSTPNVATDYHLYAVEWTEEEIRWYIDGEHYHTFKNEHKTYKEWPFDKPQYLILNIAIGGFWGAAKGIDPNLTEAKMQVDYVRVYQMK